MKNRFGQTRRQRNGVRMIERVAPAASAVLREDDILRRDAAGALAIRTGTAVRIWNFILGIEDFCD
ncbi:hypothetical protein [Duganella caerulea]|uniref:hypothetical protein n=1 Tax=Duganella caerulea TaxID=2885762 RepID=UPI004037A0BE